MGKSDGTESRDALTRTVNRFADGGNIASFILPLSEDGKKDGKTVCGNGAYPPDFGGRR